MCDGNGIYHDYNFVNRRRSMGVSDDKIVCRETLKKLEFEYSVSVGDESTGGYGFQWSFPNV